jgi:hypothetical protein
VLLDNKKRNSSIKLRDNFISIDTARYICALLEIVLGDPSEQTGEIRGSKGFELN